MSNNLRFVLLYAAICKHRHFLTIVTIHFVSLKYYPNGTCLTGAADLSEQLACSLSVTVMQGNLKKYGNRQSDDDNLIHTSMFT
jgi:hypothetical protein